MKELISTIRAAVIDDASLEARAAGAAACRAILAALESEPGQPLATPSAGPTINATLPAFAQLDADQVLELVIAKLRSMQPENVTLPATTARFQVPLVPTPRGLGGGL